MRNVATTEEHNGYLIEVCYDSDPMNPRTEYDNGGTMLCLHGRYSLGDEHNHSTPVELANAVVQSVEPNMEDFDELGEAEEYFDKLPIVVLPLYLYDHSGITMSTTPFSCPWDSGRVGLIYITHKHAEKFYGFDPDADDFVDKVKQALISEVTTYDQYLTGQVYGYRVLEKTEDEDCEGDEVDACWGIFGEEFALEMAKEYIDG